MKEISLVPLDKHISLTSSGKIREICNPLMSSLNTKYFNFVRRFIDGRQFCLTTDAEWMALFLKEKLYEFIVIEKDSLGCIKSGSQVKFLPWKIFDSKILTVQRNFSNISNGIAIANINPSHTDYYHFGAESAESWMNEFYLSNATLLQRFCDYFREKTAPLLEASSKVENLLYLPISQPHPDAGNSIDIQKFITETQTKKYFFGDTNKIAISQKEMACVKLMCLGLSAREIAEKLFLSKRTIETHTNNVKTRFGFKSKSELVIFFNSI